MKMACRLATVVVVVVVVSVLGGLVVECSEPWDPSPHEKGKHKDLLKMTKEHAADIKLVFLGDSITERWKTHGAEVWAKHYAHRHAYNYGIGGDRTEHVLWRIGQGEFDNVHPDLIVLMIGELDPWLERPIH